MCWHYFLQTYEFQDELGEAVLRVCQVGRLWRAFPCSYVCYDSSTPKHGTKWFMRVWSGCLGIVWLEYINHFVTFELLYETFQDTCHNSVAVSFFSTQTVPYGVLCFMSSYKMLEKLTKRWQVYIYMYSIGYACEIMCYWSISTEQYPNLIT